MRYNLYRLQEILGDGTQKDFEWSTGEIGISEYLANKLTEEGVLLLIIYNYRQSKYKEEFKKHLKELINNPNGVKNLVRLLPL